VQGIQGPTGIQGTDGADGVQGITGTGVQGIQGVQGSDGGAGGGGSYALWQAYGSMSSVSFSNTENNITWGSLAINPNSDISLSGSEITINTAGVYKFTVTLRTDSSNRTELFVKTYLDNGAGYNWRNTDIVSDYVSRDNDQDTGAVTLITALSLSATNKIQFRGQGDCDGTCVSLNDGTILIIERVA
jgi:hypothetical protein